VLPRINVRNLILEADVAADVDAGRFHLYPIDTVEQAVELFTGVPAGKPDRKGHFPADSVVGRAMATLSEFDAIITQRKRDGD